jgi:D-cysteine desulfhydrase
VSLALAHFLPHLARRIPHITLGEWPTPLAPVDIDGRPIWIKDEGASHPLYGGNKIRTLEMWFGHAVHERNARRIWAIGAYGSNHAIATVLHAPRAGLDAGAIVFPQPASEWAVENCGALIASGCPIVRVSNVALMPLAAMRIARRELGAIVMPPGGATPIGTIGALSGALELAMQIEQGLAPPPKRIVVGVGSTCTTAGLVAGLAIAHAIGAWRWPLPIVHGVRVTPWPVTAPILIAELVRRTLARIATLGGPRVAIDRSELLARFVIDGREIGDGYGRPTSRGHDATRTLSHPRLDGVYSAKAAAGLLRLHRSGVGPLVFWSSKSQVVLPSPELDALRDSHPALVRWLRS